MSEELEYAPTDSHRFFRVDPVIYEGIRSFMDAEFGHPKPGTVSCLPSLAEARRDELGNVLASATHAEAALAGDLLEELLIAEQVEEITRASWIAALPSVDES